MTSNEINDGTTDQENRRTGLKVDLVSKIPGRPATNYHPISEVIPFAQWGVDLIGAFLEAEDQKKYVIMAIDYFTKWVEVEASANITTYQC